MTCKECTERHIGCHSKCEEYAKEKERVAKITRMRREHDQASAYLSDRCKDRIAFEARHKTRGR